MSLNSSQHATVHVISVGSSPSHLKYTDDCGTVVVANEGNAGKDEAGAYIDPQGSVTIIHGERTGNPSVRMVDFSQYNIGQPNYKYVHPFISSRIIHVISRDLYNLTLNFLAQFKSGPYRSGRHCSYM